MTTSAQREHLERVLGDRYRIERELGRGGMAVVYLAHDVRHDRRVAVKVMHPELGLALGRERFLREIRLAAGMSHPHILAVHDSGDADGALFYVMPYVEGESLRQRLARDGRLSVGDAVRIAGQAAEALGYAHARGVVHRDVKPENILLSGNHALVADFGIARAVDAARDDRLTETGVSLGTPAYMSPEQALGDHVDARADVWALGCVLYEMLTGEPPFGRDPRSVTARGLNTVAEPLRRVRPDVPASVERVVTLALAREPAARLASGVEFAQACIAAPVERRRLDAVRLGAGALVAVLAVLGIATAFRGRVRRVPASTTAAARHSSRDSIANELYRRGRSLQTRRTVESTSRALAFFDEAIARDSGFARAWAAMAWTAQLATVRALAIPGRSQDSLVTLAVRASDRAVELDANDAESWLVRARVTQSVDPTSRREEFYALRRALALDSANADIWFEVGLAREEVLDAAGSVAAWRRAVALDPGNLQALAFLGLHYLWSGDFALGVPWADSAVKLEPTHLLAREAAGQLAFELGQVDEAEQQFQATLRVTVGREQVPALCGLARVALTRGDRRAAQRYAAQAIALANLHHPTKHEAPYIGSVLAALGDTAGALRWINAYQPRGDLHFQLHLKRDPSLRWLRGAHGVGILTPAP